jgi:outer membrane protein OmpA-like peptidoglycan-associated protein
VGKSEPVVPDKYNNGSDNPEGRARNRRVETLLELCDAGGAK